MIDRTLRLIRVAVYDRGRGRGGLIAYTGRNLGRPGTCPHVMAAVSGVEAQRAAVKVHRARCMGERT